MSGHGAFESCVRSLDVDARAERRAVRRQQLGDCQACGVALARHFDDRNGFLSCEDVLAYTAAVEAHDSEVSTLVADFAAFDAAATARQAAMHALIDQAKVELDALALALALRRTA